MKNLAIQMKLAGDYSNHAYTHNYIFTFEFCDNIWALVLEDVNADKLMTLTKLDKASRGAGYALRFKPTKSDKAALLAMGAKVLCSKDYFEAVCDSNKYNKGENAEKMVTEQMFGQAWEKDSVPFTIAGDIEANGKAYQHKHQGATFCNEKTLASLCK